MRSYSRSSLLREQSKLDLALHTLLCAKCKQSFWYPDQPAFLRLSCGHSLCKNCRTGLVDAGEREFLCEHLPADQGSVQLVRPPANAIETYDSSHAVITLLEREIDKIWASKCSTHSKGMTRIARKDKGVVFLCPKCPEEPDLLFLDRKELEKRLLKLSLDVPRFDMLVDDLERAFADRLKPVANGNDVIRALFALSKRFWEVTLPQVICTNSPYALDLREEVVVLSCPRLAFLAKAIQLTVQVLTGGSANWQTQAESAWKNVVDHTGIDLEFGAKRQTPKKPMSPGTVPRLPTGPQGHPLAVKMSHPSIPGVSGGLFGDRFMADMKKKMAPAVQNPGESSRDGLKDILVRLDRLESRTEHLETENKQLRRQLQEVTGKYELELQVLRGKVSVMEHTMGSCVPSQEPMATPTPSELGIDLRHPNCESMVPDSKPDVLHRSQGSESSEGDPQLNATGVTQSSKSRSAPEGLASPDKARLETWRHLRDKMQENGGQGTSDASADTPVPPKTSPSIFGFLRSWIQPAKEAYLPPENPKEGPDNAIGSEVVLDNVEPTDETLDGDHYGDLQDLAGSVKLSELREKTDEASQTEPEATTDVSQPEKGDENDQKVSEAG